MGKDFLSIATVCWYTLRYLFNEWQWIPLFLIKMSTLNQAWINNCHSSVWILVVIVFKIQSNCHKSLTDGLWWQWRKMTASMLPSSGCTAPDFSLIPISCWLFVCLFVCWDLDNLTVSLLSLYSKLGQANHLGSSQIQPHHQSLHSQ